MAAPFPWDELLELIAADQRAVPVAGPELSTLPAEGGLSFDRYAAQHIAAANGLAGEDWTLSRVAMALRRQGRNPAQLTRELSLLHRQLLAGMNASTVPEALRQLAEIRDFPLIVTTAPDGLLATAIRIARERDAGPLAYSLGDETDLPRNWMQGPKPTLFHLFGRINAVPDFRLTEEDVLEFLHRLQTDAHRPEQLFDELRTRHLLLLGLKLPDWALRLFLRTLHGTRLSEDNGQTIVIAGEMVTRDPVLAAYLRETSRRVWIYEDGTAADFVREMHRRWHAAQEEGWSTTTDGQAVPAEPAEIIPGAVYLSAARADRAAAERLAAVLDEAGLDAWFDRTDAPSGPRYERRIRQHLQECDLFLPLLSPSAEGNPDAFFRKEWSWALERHEASHTGARFVQPVWVGEGAPPANASAPFEGFAVQGAPAGQPTPELLRECVEAVRRARADRNV
jgi:hypothetical protein